MTKLWLRQQPMRCELENTAPSSPSTPGLIPHSCLESDIITWPIFFITMTPPQSCYTHESWQNESPVHTDTHINHRTCCDICTQNAVITELLCNMKTLSDVFLYSFSKSSLTPSITDGCAFLFCTHLSAFMLNHTLPPPPWLHPSIVHILSHPPLQSDIKSDDLLLKGSRTKDRSKEKKGSKDKKKGHAADGPEKRPSKAKVDELLVRPLHSDKAARINVHADSESWRYSWHAGVQQGAGEWVQQLWRLAPYFQLVQRKSRGWRGARSGWWQDCRQIQSETEHKNIRNSAS